MFHICICVVIYELDNLKIGDLKKRIIGKIHT